MEVLGTGYLTLTRNMLMIQQISGANNWHPVLPVTILRK